MKLPRSPQSLASSSRHVWTGPLPVIVGTTAIVPPSGALVLDMRSHIARRDAAMVVIPPGAFKVFAAIACGGRAVSKRDIGEYVWGDDARGGPDWWDKTIDVHVSKLRKTIAPLKIGILGRHSFGYQLIDLAKSAEAA